MVKEELQFYLDTLIVETILRDPRIKKEAQSGVVSSLVQKVFGYVHDKVKEFKDSDHKAAMITNFMVPGILTAFGFPVLGFLSKIAQMLFHFDLTKIFSEIASEVKNLITGGKQTTSSDVDNIVTKVFNSNIPSDPTEESMKDSVKSFTENKTALSKLTLREAELFKIALEDYVLKNPDTNIFNPEMNVKIAAGLFNSALATFVASRNKTTKILISVVGWIVKAILAAAGFMVIGDAINKIVGTSSSSIDGQPTAPETQNVPVTSAPVAQNVFKANPGYVEENNNGPMARWILQSDINSIGNIILSWATEIYPDLKGHEDAIRSARTFNLVINAIKAYNQGSPPNMVFIPRQWKSRKQVVDQFMGELAQYGNIKPTPNKDGIIPIPNYVPPVTKTV